MKLELRASSLQVSRLKRLRSLASLASIHESVAKPRGEAAMYLRLSDRLSMLTGCRRGGYKSEPQLDCSQKRCISNDFLSSSSISLLLIESKSSISSRMKLLTLALLSLGPFLAHAVPTRQQMIGAVTYRLFDDVVSVAPPFLGLDFRSDAMFVALLYQTVAERLTILVLVLALFSSPQVRFSHVPRRRRQFE